MSVASALRVQSVASQSLAVAEAIALHEAAAAAVRAARSDRQHTRAERRCAEAARVLSDVRGQTPADALAILRTLRTRLLSKSDCPFGIGAQDKCNFAIFENAIRCFEAP